MAKKQKEEMEETVTTEQLLKPVLITEASIKEQLCNYGYEINAGPGTGDKIKRKGSALVHEDMVLAFDQLNKHLAYIDDAFVHIKKKASTVVDMLSHEDIISNFRVTGFKVHGTDENEGFILMGDKFVSQGCIGLETPKIGAGSGYPFFDDLGEIINICRDEVELYMNGKQTPKAEQLELGFDETANENNEFGSPI